MNTDAIHRTLAELLVGRRLPADAAEAFFTAALAGELDEAQLAAALSLIQARRPTVAELVGAARAMRARVVPVAPPDDVRTGEAALIDTCGTGGAPKMFNVSTTAAIVAAAIRPPDPAAPSPAGPTPAGAAARTTSASRPQRLVVAKHGNRSRTGRGSAEVLAALGVNLDATPDQQARCLAELGVCFCFAVNHHPAMRHAIGPRRSLGFPTIFNLLGPLTNPAGARRQVVGVYRPELLGLMARALAGLGAERAIVAHGRATLDTTQPGENLSPTGPTGPAGPAGLDELTTLGPTTLVHVQRPTPSAEPTLRTERLEPQRLGFEPAGFAAMRVGTVEQAAAAARAVLAGEPGPRLDTVLLSAAAAAVVAGAADTIAQGIELARDAIATGRAAATLERLAEVSHA